MKTLTTLWWARCLRPRRTPGRAGSGPAGIAHVRAAVGLPLFAIGGVTAERVPEVIAAGAQGVAVLSGIWSAGDPAAAVAKYLGVL